MTYRTYLNTMHALIADATPTWDIRQTSTPGEDTRYGLFVNGELKADDFYSHSDAEIAAFHLELPGSSHPRLTAFAVPFEPELKAA